MKKETKECIQIYIPLILAVSLNGLTGLVSMSDYAEGFYREWHCFCCAWQPSKWRLPLSVE